jgi:TPR repeat protein
MDKEFLQKIGLKDTTPSNELISRLEEKQLEYLERIENATDNKRKIELHQELQKIEKGIEEVKQSLTAASMGIILDDATEMDEDLKNKEVEKQEVEKKAEQKAKINKEVEGIKKKQPQNEQQTVNGSKPQSHSDNSNEKEKSKEAQEKEPEVKDHSSDSGDTRNAELSDGLKAYKAGNHSKAFQIFKNLSEAKNAQAQFLLARMYEKGEGMQPDNERSRFWYKNSADNGNADSQYAYALLLKEDKAQLKEIMACLEKACNQNHLKALQLYIDIMIECNNYNKRYVTNALKYSDKIAELETDSFTVASYHKKRKSIIRLQTAGTVFNIFKTIQNILIILGILYAYLGCRHTQTFGIPLISAPVIPIKWNFLDKLLHGVFTTNGIFGILLLLIGTLLCGMIDNYKLISAKYNQMIGKAATLLVIGLPIWQFIRIFQAHISWKTQIGFIILTWGVMILGNIVGAMLPAFNIKKGQ